MLIKVWKKCISQVLLVGRHNGNLCNRIPYKSKHVLPYNSIIVLLCIYSKRSKTYVHIKACITMFIAALSAIIKCLSPCELT